MIRGILVIRFLVLFLLLILVGCERVLIKDNSMQPTLSPGDAFYVHRYRKDNHLRSKVFVFYFPYGDYSSSYHICSGNIFIKRCVGVPGDTITVSNGVVLNNGNIILPLRPGTDLTLNHSDKDVITNRPGYREANRYNLPDIYIPKRGDQIKVDDYSLHLYRRIFVFETGKVPVYGDYYTFEENYFFSCGDNISDSWDSRFWGFVPESYIIGYINL